MRVLLCLAAFCVAALCSDPQLSPQALQEDYRVFRGALEEGHSGIYRYRTQAEMDRTFDRAAAQLKHPLSPLEFWRVLAPVVAAIQCGHTSIGMPQADRLIPIEAVAIDNHLYIRRDFVTGGKLAGQEILTINGTGAGRILSSMLAVIPGDGASPTLRLWRIRSNFRGLLHGALGIESPFTLQLRDPDGIQQTVRLTGLPPEEIPQDQRPANPADFRLFDDGRIAVLKIYSFDGQPGPRGSKPLGETIDDAYHQMHDKESRALILDVRDNNGGADELGKKLFSYLIAEPFRYYDDLVLNKREFSFFKPIPADQVEQHADGKFHQVSHPNWGRQQPSQPYFGGKVFALMNGGSFSTTCEFLSTLHFHKRATFIGEEAGGGYYGNSSGMVAEVTLPNSHLKLRVPLVTYYLAVSGMPKDRSIPPDVAVHYTIQERVSGVDKEMEAALRLARAAH